MKKLHKHTQTQITCAFAHLHMQCSLAYCAGVMIALKSGCTEKVCTGLEAHFVERIDT